jgi:hypothetical protein
VHQGAPPVEQHTSDRCYNHASILTRYAALHPGNTPVRCVEPVPSGSGWYKERVATSADQGPLPSLWAKRASDVVFVMVGVVSVGPRDVEHSQLTPIGMHQHDRRTRGHRDGVAPLPDRMPK